MPARAAAAATALARLPVEGQANTWSPSSRAADRATATTRSLKECVGLPGVVLDPELFQTEIIRKIAGIDQPGETGIGRAEGGDVGWDRQQRGISPDAPRARLDPAPGDGRELVADLERTEALGTDVVRAERRNGPTLATDEVGGIPESAGPDATSRSLIGVDDRGHDQSLLHLSQPAFD